MPLPEYNKYKEASLIPKSIVNEIRNRFLKEVAKSPDEYYQEDIDRIKTNDWHITRFIIEMKYNVEEALKAVIAANKWRKSFGVRELTTSDFPKEVYQSSAAFVYGTDINGSKVVISRLKVTIKIIEWVQTFRKLGIFNLEQLDQSFDGKGITSLFHCKGIGLKYVDIDGSKFALKVMKEYYPGLMKAQLCHELPSIIEPVIKVVLVWLNDDEKNGLLVTNKNNINEYIAKEQLPDFMCGTNTQNYRIVPNDSPSAVQLANSLGLKDGAAEQLIKHYEQYFND